jgi:hypothetical protein
MPSRTASKLVPLAVLLLTASVAEAQSSTDTELAQSLFERGRALMTAGKYAEACPVLAESQRLDPGGGTLLNLAFCHEKEGKNAKAWSEYNVALGGAVKDGRKDREDLARQRIAALEPTLSHLTVAVPSPVDGLVVSLDGVTLGPAAWGVATAVDPGSHRVMATVSGLTTFDRSIDVHENGDSQVVTIPAPPPLAPLPTAAAPGPMLPMTVSPASLFTVSCDSGKTWNGTACVKPPSPGKSGWRWVALGGAAIATGLATGAGIVALEDQSTMNSDCIVSRSFCPNPAGVGAGSAATTWAWVSTISTGVAVASFAAFVFWPDKKVTVTPAPAGSGAGVLATGRF